MCKSADCSVKPVSSEDDAPALLDESSQDIPQIASGGWVHPRSGLILYIHTYMYIIDMGEK